jgi:PAS domain-containing protein
MAPSDRTRPPRLATPTSRDATEPARLWFDAEHRIVECNEAAAALFRCAPGALVGLHLVALLPALGDARELSWARLAFLARCGVRFSVARPDGTTFEATLSVAHAGAEPRVPMLVLRPTSHAGPKRVAAPLQGVADRSPR